MATAGCGGNGGGGENLTLTPPDRRRCWCRERCPATWWIRVRVGVRVGVRVKGER